MAFWGGNEPVNVRGHVLHQTPSALLQNYRRALKKHCACYLAQVLQQKLKDLDRAFMNAFDKNQPNKRMVKVRKKNIHDSFRFPEPKQFKIENCHIKLPKIGWVRFYQSQDIKGTPKNATVSRSGNHWYVFIQVEQAIVAPVCTAIASVGIDVGIVKFAAASNGATIA